MNAKRTIFIFGLTLLMVSGLMAQTRLDYVKAKKLGIHQLEISVMPFYAINSFSLGYSYVQNARTEHVALLNLSKTYGSGSYNASYNFNKAFKGISKKLVTYIPFWFRYKRANRSWNELNSFYYHESWRPDSKITRLTIGTGIGNQFFLKKSNAIRFEFGIGAQVTYSEEIKREDFTFLPRDLNTEAKLQKNYITYFPNAEPFLHYITPTCRINITYVFKLKKS